MELKIDSEISGCQRRLTQDEYDQLETNILSDGCVLEPIVVWKGQGVIVDGENRYSICRKHSLKFSVHEMEFADRAQAILWVIGHQVGRRNLDSVGMAMLRAELLKETGGDVKAVAEAFGVSTRQVYRDALTKQGLELMPADLQKRYEKGALVATQRAFRRLIELDEPRREEVYRKVRSENDCTLDEAIPSEPPKAVMSERDHALQKELFTPGVRRSIAAGTIVASDGDMAKLHKLPGEKQVLVADLLETGDISNLAEAIELTKEPKKRREPKVDMDKLKNKVADAFAKLRRTVDEYGLAVGVNLQSVHDAINIAEDNLP